MRFGVEDLAVISVLTFAKGFMLFWMFFLLHYKPHWMFMTRLSAVGVFALRPQCVLLPSCSPELRARLESLASGYHVRLLLLALAPSWLPGWLPSPAAWDCKCASGFSLNCPRKYVNLTLSCLNVRSLPNKTDDVLEVIRVFLSHCYKTDTTLSDTDLVVDLAVAFAA